MFAEDLTVFLDTAGFAVTATAGASSFPVIFDAASAQAGLVADIGPQATCKTADVAGVEFGDSVSINGTAYTVTAIQPDGTGVTVLQLRQA